MRLPTFFMARCGAKPAGGTITWARSDRQFRLSIRIATIQHMSPYSATISSFSFSSGHSCQYTLANYAEQCTGSTFQDVLDYNKSKLASRAARGVLRGAGDHR